MVTEVVGNPVNYNAAVERAFTADAVRLMKQVMGAVESRIITLMAQDREDLSQAFMRLMDDIKEENEGEVWAVILIIAAALYRQFNKVAQTQVRNALRPILSQRALDVSERDTERDKVTLFIAAALARLTLNFIQAVETEGARQIMTNPIDTARANMDKFFGRQRDTVKRSIKRNIPRDSRDIQSTLALAKFTEAGITLFMWDYSIAHRRYPRLYHKEVLHRQIFSIENPPVIDEDTGERGLPGQAYGCLCRLKPVFRP